MKILKWIFFIVAIFIGLLLLVLVAAIVLDGVNTRYMNPPTQKDSYLITNVHVVPMQSDTVWMNQMVLIKNGKIDKIAPTIEAPDVEILNAENQYLFPGLIDMHVHVWDTYELGLYLANGVTAVRNLWGMPMHLRIKEAILQDKMIAPHFYTTGSKLTGSEFIGDDNLNVGSPEQARQLVHNYKARGYDFIKTYYGLEKNIFDAVIDAASDSQMDIVAHPSQKVPFSYHLHPQIKSIEHAEEIVQQPLQFDLDTNKLEQIIDAIAQAPHTSYCPTLVVFNNIYQMMLDDTILDSETMNYMNPMIRKVDSQNQFERWFQAKNEDPATIKRIKKQHDFHLIIVQKLHEAGVNIICGTDAGIGITPAGFSIHQELAFYQQAGLSNYEVLKTATINPSKTHRPFEQMGSIAPGKIANLVLVHENPLQQLSTLQKPSMLFVKGKKVESGTLQKWVSKAKKRKNLLVSGLRYVEYLLREK